MCAVQCTGRGPSAFRSVLHAFADGSALQALTPEDKFLRLNTGQGSTSWTQSVRTMEGGKEGKARCLAKLVTVGCLQPEKSALSPTAGSDSNLTVPVTQTGSDCLLPPD